MRLRNIGIVSKRCFYIKLAQYMYERHQRLWKEARSLQAINRLIK